MHTYPIKQVDVFSDKTFCGNPVAVLFNADDIPDAQMQRIACWTNLSETAFIQKSNTADYRLRIFSPRSELPFAAHPTVGSAHAARGAGLVPRGKRIFQQECAGGLIEITVGEDEAIFARVPRPKILSTVLGKADLCKAVGDTSCSAGAVVDVGPVWIVAKVEDSDRLYNLTVDSPRLVNLSQKAASIGLCVYAINGKQNVHLRTFAPAIGVSEDPVCGSGTAAVAAHIRATGQDKIVSCRYVTLHGRALGREGRVEVIVDGDDVTIGGKSKTVVDGEIRF